MPDSPDVPHAERGSAPERGEAQLRALLLRVDGSSYGAYRQLRGRWRLPDFTLRVDQVQGDPFAAPSCVALCVSPAVARLPAWALTTSARRVSTSDFLLRQLAHRAAQVAGVARAGSGGSGRVSAALPSQEVLERSAVQVSASGAVEARVRVGLPARGRRVLGRAALALLVDDLSRLVAESLVAGACDLPALERHVHAVEDQQALRAQLAPAGLVAFVADGATLPRRSGVDPRPMAADVVTTWAPDTLAVTLHAPHSGPLRGLGVPAGLTLVVGGGFHGKSTLLRALELGVYDHVPGDGRERVVTRSDAVKVRAEDGRAVHGVDISLFIGQLPGGVDTTCFTTDDASGSTSQAAAMVEAWEAGSQLLLLDEDTSATNLLVRDARMAALVAADKEPISPLVDRVAALRSAGLSVVLVVGGTGAYFGHADTVLWLDSWRVVDATVRAHALADEATPAAASPRSLPGAGTAATGALPTRRPWTPDVARVALADRRGRLRVRADDVRRVTLGEQEVDLRGVDQLVAAGQVRAAGLALADVRAGAQPAAGPRPSVATLLDDLELWIADEGLDVLSERPRGDLARPRRYEVAALLARLRRG